MKKYIYSALIAACVSTAMTAQAQQKVYLNKGTQKVETVELADGDYISLGRPAGVPAQRLAEIINAKTTKNSVNYTILTKSDNQPFYQMMVSEMTLQLFMEQYMGYSLATATPEELNETFSTLLYAGYGYGQIGTTDFKKVNGEEDEISGETSFVIGGVNYYIVTCDLVIKNNQYVLGNDMSYKVVKTAEPGESSEQLDIAYNGLDDEGMAMFSVTPGSGLKTLHMVLGKSRSVDEMTSIYGYNNILASDATNFTVEQWNTLKDEDKKWDISAEDDYTFVVAGVDANGDQVRKELTNIHIKPIADDLCPNVDNDSFTAENGEVNATFSLSSKTSSPITKATVLAMKETDWDLALNNLISQGTTTTPSEGWPTVARGTGAVDVTSQIADGKYTYNRTFTEAERDWYVLVFAVTDENGTTITRISFHTHLDNAIPEIISHTYPVASASAKKAAKAPGAKLSAKTVGHISLNAKGGKKLNVIK